MSTSNENQIVIVNVYYDKPDVYCGRGSALGNPFKMENSSNDCERDLVCSQYEEYFNQKVLETRDQAMLRQLTKIFKILMSKGSVKLGCFCAPKRCHCETIKRYIEETYLKNKG